MSYLHHKPACTAMVFRMRGAIGRALSSIGFGVGGGWKWGWKIKNEKKKG